MAPRAIICPSMLPPRMLLLFSVICSTRGVVTCERIAAGDTCETPPCGDDDFLELRAPLSRRHDAPESEDVKDASSCAATGTAMLQRSAHRVPSVHVKSEGSRQEKPKLKIGSGSRGGRWMPAADSDLFNGTVNDEAAVGICGSVETAHAQSNMFMHCPQECSLWARLGAAHHENAKRTHCEFQCVPSTIESCKQANPAEPIPDAQRGVCRSCIVVGCKRCDTSVDHDRCAECSLGYALVDGECMNEADRVWHVVMVVVGSLILGILMWIAWLVMRPITNMESLKIALLNRSRSKLHMPKDVPHEEKGPPLDVVRTTSAASSSEQAVHMHHPAQRHLWPLTTNLLHTEVAGPGLLLFFHFQFAILVWAALILVAWIVYAFLINDGFVSLWGSSAQAGSPRQACIMNARGYHYEHAALLLKAMFISVAYVVSFILALAHSVHQLRTFQRLDREEETHRVFCAICTGLPEMSGSQPAEELIKSVIVDELKNTFPPETNDPIVGISLCWDFMQDEGPVMHAIGEELRVAELSSNKASPRSSSSRRRRRWIRPDSAHAPEETAAYPSGDCSAATSRVTRESAESDGELSETEETPRDGPEKDAELGLIARIYLSETFQGLLTKGRSRRRARHLKHRTPRPTAAGEEEEDVASVLRRLRSTSKAFVVFETEEARDRAVQAAQEVGIHFKGKRLSLEAAHCEPDTVIWPYLRNTSFSTRFARICGGVFILCIAMLVWAVVFYAPCAYFLLDFNYKNSAEPNAFGGLAFSMVVVLGNAIMYVTCAWISEFIQFSTVDDREACYLLLYSFAVYVNIIFDMFVVCVVAYRIMAANEIPTFSGEQVHEVGTFAGLLRSYAVQSMMQEQLLAYCFPATFLIPFLVEPIATVAAPYWLAKLIVRSHADIKPQAAEGYLASAPMDLSRYADILVNVTLAVLIFQIGGGRIVFMFTALLISHSYVYAYDHYRVLRSIPKCDFASMDVDWWACWLLSVPLGFLAAAAVHKATEWYKTHYGLEDAEIMLACTGTFICHVILHTLLLVFWVPRYGLSDDELPAIAGTYKECAERIACSWFNANPVHCLRSKYIYDHRPPAMFCAVGKEHLLTVNEDIGAYYEEDALDIEEDYDRVVDVKDVCSISEEISREVSDMGSEVSREVLDLQRRFTESSLLTPIALTSRSLASNIPGSQQPSARVEDIQPDVARSSTK